MELLKCFCGCVKGSRKHTKHRLLDLLPKVRIFLWVSVVRRVDYLEKSIKHLLEDVSWCNLVEEVHGRLEFDDVDMTAHDVLNVSLAGMSEERTADGAEAFAQDGVLREGAGFVDAIECVEFGVVTVPKSLALREYVPNSVVHLSAVLHFVEGGSVVAFLCFKEAVEVVDFLSVRHCNRVLRGVFSVVEKFEISAYLNSISEA